MIGRFRCTVYAIGAVDAQPGMMESTYSGPRTPYLAFLHAIRMIPKHTVLVTICCCYGYEPVYAHVHAPNKRQAWLEQKPKNIQANTVLQKSKYEYEYVRVCATTRSRMSEGE